MNLSFIDDDEGLDYVIKRLIERKSRLSKWESGFVHNIAHKRKTYTGGYPLTNKQKEVISKMWEKY